MTRTPTWRPAGASDHPGWEVISRAILAIANRTARLSATYIEAEQEAVRAVNELLERMERQLPPSPHVEYSASRGQSKVEYWVSREKGDRIWRAAMLSGSAAPPSSDAAEGVGESRFDESVEVQTDFERGRQEGIRVCQSLMDDVSQHALANELEIEALKARLEDLRRQSEHKATSPKPAPDAVREAIAEIFYEVMPYDMDGVAFIGKPAWEPGRNSPRQNEARAYADRALTISAPAPSPDAILPCDVHLPVNTYIRKGCTVESLMTAISKREGFPHDATVFSVPSPDGAGEQQIRDLLTFVASQCQRDIDPEGAASLDTIETAYEAAREEAVQAEAADAGAAEPDDDWEARSERSYIDNAAAEPDSMRDLPLLWNGRANTLRILNGKRAQIDQATCGEADCYEQCAKELRELLSTPAVRDEHHIARFLTRLIYRRGVAYGKGLESEDAWVDTNWQSFREDARWLGGIAPVARPSIEQLCVAIADGYNNGNQQYEECDAFARMRFHAAAKSVSRLFLSAIGVTTRKKRAEQIQSILAETLVIQDGEVVGTGPASYRIADAISPTVGVEQP